MQLAGDVDGAFPGNGIPSGRIRNAVHLAFKSHLYGRIINAASGHLSGGFPGGATRGSAKHLYFTNYPLFNGNGELGSAESLPIVSEHTVPGERASGGRC
jgi:hypothetical protein